MQKKLVFYRKEIKTLQKQLEDTLNINKIIDFENEEVEKKRALDELENEKSKLQRLKRNIGGNEDFRSTHAVIIRKDELYEQLKKRRQELKDKTAVGRKQEKQIKDQHEIISILEEKCRKVKDALKMQKMQPLKEEIQKKTEEQTTAEIKGLEFEISQEKRNYKDLITHEENEISELQLLLDRLNLEAKQKDQVFSL